MDLLNQHTRQYWTKEDVLALEQADTMRQMFDVALRVLKRMPQPVSQVCGPISTGGKGNVLENLVVFNETIVFLQAEGRTIFDQMPFEAPMQRYKVKLIPGQYATEILNDFYLPILESGLIKKLIFMKGWEDSKGAVWEHEEAKRLGIEIDYL